MSFDYASQREAGAGPGADTRQWTSIGVVNADQPNAPAVDFTNKSGPLVNVRLHPSDIDVRCRVASFVAGAGEGEWHPFGGGDEVIVLLPLGHERGGAIIVGRMNNGVDTFPSTVANADVTQNNVSTKRSVPNFLWEIENGWLLRSVTTTAQFGLDAKGGWILSSGDNHFVSLSSTGALLSLAKLQSYVSLNASNGQAVISVGTAGSQNKASILLDPATANIYARTSGSLPVGHVATVEGVVSMFNGFLVGLAAILIEAGVVPLTGPTLAALLAPAPPLANPAIMLQGIPAALLNPITPYVPVITAALATPRDPTGLIVAGLGAAGFLV